LLQKVPVGKYLGINVVLWGIATGCTAAATNFETLVIARVFLGIFEVGIFIFASGYYMARLGGAMKLTGARLQSHHV
jgi:MFS family permease